MPGHAFNLYCSGCETKHEVSTGSVIGGRWLEQKVCTSCQRIVSCWPRDPDEDPERCPDCKGQLKPWSGKVWFEPRPGEPDAPKEERFEGPCPKCATKITLEDQIGPDGTLTVTLWD
jgi:hypothetical protein